jgi:hypothetical protein
MARGRNIGTRTATSGRCGRSIPYAPSISCTRTKVTQALRRRLSVGRRPSALPAESLISNSTLAISTAKSSTAVYSASSTPPLNPVISQTAGLPSDVPPRTLRASSRTHPMHSGMLGLLLRRAGVRDVTGKAQPYAARQRW